MFRILICYNFAMTITETQHQGCAQGQKFYYFAFTSLAFSHSHAVKVQGTHKTIRTKNIVVSFFKKHGHQLLISQPQELYMRKGRRGNPPLRHYTIRRNSSRRRNGHTIQTTPGETGASLALKLVS